jgi:hypothetical protein
MGIKFLNKFLTEKCKSIKKLSLEKFRGEIIVIDTSIYMYKFLSENALIENMTKMIEMFQIYNITPVYIFDGKPPPEKKELLIQRNLFKSQAEERYNELSKSESCDPKELQALRNQFLKVYESDIVRVKELFAIMGVKYFESTTESDPICGYLVNSGKCFACLTEDMDMFVYGCNRIFRSLNLETHEIYYYDFKLILRELNISFNHFKQILVLSGTDYDVHSSTHLYTTIALYNKFKNSGVRSPCFYQWLEKYYSSYIKNRDKLNHCFEMFDFDYYKTDLEPFVHLTRHDFTSKMDFYIQCL